MQGIRLESKKENLIEWTIRRFPPPAKVFIPLHQVDGSSSVSCVMKGSKVRVGEKIADAADRSSVALHASISGVVTGIEYFSHPVDGEGEVIAIQSDDRDEKIPEIGRERHGWQNLSSQEMFALFQDSGLVDLNSQMFPLHVKTADAAQRGVSTLVLNGCESEPYVTADYALTMSHPLEILKGAEILRRITGAEEVVFAIEDNKLEAAEILKSKIFFLKWKQCRVEILPALYPQDSEILLTQQFASGTSALAVVFNVATAFSVYEAVVLQKPLYERPVTIAGECVIEPKNQWIRFGTLFRDAIKSCRGLLREPEKILMGGPMRGHAQLTQDVPVIKGTQAILSLPKEVVKPEDIGPCIRCGRCIEVCPVDISPVMITLAAERNLFEDVLEYEAEECIECGNCAYICPAKRPMVELIRYGMLNANRKF